jgi:uncharacterized protein YydD (DUF2326 family)
MQRRYTKNGNGARYYVQVNNFNDRIFSAPAAILEEQITEIDGIIKSREDIGRKACEKSDKTSCELTNFHSMITKNGWIADRYMLKVVAQIRMKQSEIEQFKAQEIIRSWEDVSVWRMKKLDLQRQLAEERSRLELIADDAGRSGKIGTRGTLETRPGL